MTEAPTAAYSPRRPRPRTKFDYPEGGGRFCGECERLLSENRTGIELHLQVEGVAGCQSLWLEVGRVDGRLVLLKGEFR